MGKYIVELEDEPSYREDGVNFYRCVSAPWWHLSSNIIKRLTPADDENIQVGDECKYNHLSFGEPEPFVITRIYYEDGKGFFDAIFKDGSPLVDGTLNIIERTGRHFPQIAEVLDNLHA